jgi:hypothetical protein
MWEQQQQIKIAFTKTLRTDEIRGMLVAILFRVHILSLSTIFSVVLCGYELGFSH